MYTLVLMSALSTAPDTAEFNGFFRRLFSFGGGCCGGSCTGSGAGSCTGSRLRAYTSCCGGAGRGYGSCTGSSLSAGACSGSGYAACSGGLMTPPTGMEPGGYAQPFPATSQFYYPSFYPMGEPGGCVGSGPGTAPMPNIPPVPGLQPPFAPPSPAVPPDSVNDSPGGRGTSYAQGGGRATVVVRLPADATLFAEGRRLALGGAERTFTTPPLPGGDWGYTFKVEYSRDGEVISRSKRVGVRPGDALVVEFTEGGLARTTKADPKPAVAEPKPAAAEQVKGVPTVVPPAGAFGGPEPARLTIKLPPGATLTVDGRKLDRSGEFRTPPLAPGKEYSYQMQTDMVKAGQPVRELTKVSFRAGELVTVDLTAGK